MVRNLIIICSAVSVLLCSCCKSQRGQGVVRPEWSAPIPTFESPEIFYDGIINLPKWGDIMVAHTTIYDGGFCAEDNRLCALDLRTGEVKWYYPADLAERRYCHVSSKGYSYGGKVVFQYARNYIVGKYRRFHTTACLDMETGRLLWERGCKATDAATRPAVGHENICYFVQDTCRISRVDLDTDTVSDFYYTGSDDLKINDILLHDGVLVVSCNSDSVEEYKCETYVVLLDASSGAELFRKHVSRSDVPSHAILEDGVLYVNAETYLTAIDIKTGEKLWGRDDYWAYTLMDMYIYGDVLLKCAGNATLGYDKKTGEILYDYRNYGSWQTSQDGRYAYLLNRRNIVDIIDIETGEKPDYIVCPNRSEGFFGSYPMIYDGKLYIMGNNTLYRYPTYPW